MSRNLEQETKRFQLWPLALTKIPQENMFTVQYLHIQLPDNRFEYVVKSAELTHVNPGEVWAEDGRDRVANKMNYENLNEYL